MNIVNNGKNQWQIVSSNEKNAGWISISFSSYLNWGGMTSTSESNLSIWGDDTSSFAWFLLLDPLVLETGLLLSSGIISNLSMLCKQSSFHDHLKHINLSHFLLIFFSETDIYAKRKKMFLHVLFESNIIHIFGK